ncbi:GDSL-like Lipase/Acylhydrolase [Thelonectria olida]|uniref:GDSL-like Lipase/Acylhydrolase n=1 Tax=Thelonectria olida TaxID=1576542 RepID=A0A9P8W6B9_9HYPO|nr:GDSL-like Lipase/Acylhydrolase [Thelonectria olida]
MRPSITLVLGVIFSILDSGRCDLPLNLTNATGGKAIKEGTKLRVLCAGDSITSGWMSSDGNGYRLKLQEDLSEDDLVFAGELTTGNMTDGYFAAWPGKTIQYISDHIGPSLDQQPNIILLHAGTNDMDDRPERSIEGNDPVKTAKRLGDLVDQMIEACPDAVILVAVIIGTCDPHKATTTPEYQALIPGIVEERRAANHSVLAVDFSVFPEEDLQDCIHPTDTGYRMLGDYWYDYMTQIPTDWIKEPTGDDPERGDDDVKSGAKKTEIEDSVGNMTRVPWLALFCSGAIALFRILL